VLLSRGFGVGRGLPEGGDDSIWPASGVIGDRRYSGATKLSRDAFDFMLSGRNRAAAWLIFQPAATR
jgi:hypothetical protein